MKARKQFLYKLVDGNLNTFFSALPPKSKQKEYIGEWFEHDPFKEGGQQDENGCWHKVTKPINW